MNEIKPEWILEFFDIAYEAVDVWLMEDATIENIYVDGAFSPRDMAKFLNKKLEEK